MLGALVYVKGNASAGGSGGREAEGIGGSKFRRSQFAGGLPVERKRYHVISGLVIT